MYKCRHGSNPNHLIHYGKSYVNHYITGVAGGDAYIIFDRNTEEEKHLKLSDYLNQF